MISATSRFVLLHHRVEKSFEQTFGRGSHYDLMLEWEGSLKTWSFTQNLLEQIAFQSSTTKKQCQFEADRLADHRLCYLDYEGPLSNNRGNVKRISSGSIKWIRNQEHVVEVSLESDNLVGTLVLERICEDQWSLTFDDRA